MHPLVCTHIYGGPYEVMHLPSPCYSVCITAERTFLLKMKSSVILLAMASFALSTKALALSTATNMTPMGLTRDPAAEAWPIFAVGRHANRRSPADLTNAERVKR